MSIKTDAVVIRDETTTGANTATRVGTNLVDIADDLVAKQAAIDLNTAKETNIAHPLVETAVPVGAVFTDNDTVYDDTAIQAEVDLNTAKVGVTAQLVSDVDTNTLKIGVTTEEANPDVVSQVEAEAGIATTERIWTAQRVKQAIDALAGGGAGVDDTAYDISWDGVIGVAPSKNALYDFIENQVFKVDVNSNILPLFWGGTQAQYDAYFNITDFPTGVPNHYFTVITDGVPPVTTASDIVNVPSGNLVADNVQGALDELQTEVDALAGGGSSTPLEKTVLNHGYSVTDNVTYEKWVEKINIATGGETVSGSVVNTFRIPSVQFASNGDLLAASEARLVSSSDDAAAGIFLARIRDNVIISKELIDTPQLGEHLLRSPNMVKDGDRIYMFFTSFDSNGTPDLVNHLKTYYRYTDDNGVTWSARVEYLASDQDDSSAFKWLTSPSNSIVHSSGDIIIPFWGKYVAGSTPTWFRSGIIVWDGTTFTKRILDAVDSINEPTIFEDENGNIVMSCRTGSTGANNRVVYSTSDKGVTWDLHNSSGADSFSVYVNIKRYVNELYKLEIDNGAVSSARKNLNLYKTNLSNENYTKILDITERDSIIWGYGSSGNYLGNFVVASEDKPDLNLYKVNIENKGILNIYNKGTVIVDASFNAPMLSNGDDAIIPLVATNGGGVTFGLSGAVFDGNDNSYLQYANNSSFVFSDGFNDIPFTISFKIKFDDVSSQTLFFNNHGVNGLNRTWGVRLLDRKMRAILTSEMDNSHNINYENNTTLIANQEYKVVITYDGNRDLVVHIDDDSSGVFTETGTYIKMGVSTNEMVVGRLLGNSTLNFAGKFRDLKIFKGVVLNTDQRLEL